MGGGGGQKILIKGSIQLKQSWKLKEVERGTRGSLEDLELDNTNLKCNIHSSIIKFKISNTNTHEEVY
jgi:hypothetical protein